MGQVIVTVIVNCAQLPVARGAQKRRALLAQALGRPVPDAPLDATFRLMLPQLARYRVAWGDANVPCAQRAFQHAI